MVDWRTQLDRLKAEREHYDRLVKDERGALEKAKIHAKAANDAQTFVQVVAEKIQKSAHGQISSLVTRCLKSVFGEEEGYEFNIEFERKRGKTEAKLLFVRDGKAVDPVDAAGGGVVDCASFALRLACLMLARPERRRLLVMDEPMKMLSEEYVPKVRVLLETLSKEFGVQIIMVTHNRNLEIGKVVEIS